MRLGGDSAIQLSTAAKLAAALLVGVFLLAGGFAFLLLPGPGEASSASSSWYNDTWRYRKRITIDSTKVSADLSNFPVLISLPSDDDLAAAAQNDGDDILFTASDGTTTLNHEIERFNGTTGELAAWVNVTSLSSTADTNLYMYYGNAVATNQENVAGTWDSDYVSAWHLDGTPPATMADSPGSLDWTPAFDGVSMTLAVQNLTGTTYDQRTAIYYMLDADLPSAGSYTVSVTASLAENIQAGAISVTGAAQQAPEATASSADGQAGDDWIETQITTSTDRAWIFDVVGSGSPRTFTPNSGQTERFDVTGPSSGTAGGTKEVTTAGTEVINWTVDGTSNRISHSLAAFAPAGAGLLIQFNTTGIRAGGEDTLVLRYNLTSGDDAFGIWIWNFTASEWAHRGTIDRTVPGFFNHTLLPEEKSGGEVRMRFNDTSPSGSTDLSVDYQLVNNTLWRSGVTFYRNTTLAVGGYSHFFWAQDTEGLENRTVSFSGPTVTGLCDALTVVTSDPAGQLWFNESVEPDGLPYTTQFNVSASFQDAATPALSVTNDGSTTCDITIRLMSDPGSGRSLKFNTTNSAPWPTDATREVPLDPSSVTVCSAVAPAGICDIWLWVDYENALGGQAFVDIRVESL